MSGEVKSRQSRATGQLSQTEFLRQMVGLKAHLEGPLGGQLDQALQRPGGDDGGPGKGHNHTVIVRVKVRNLFPKRL